MTGPGLCVLLGAPRSGTTWLQRLLSCSPAVVSPPETHLFQAYLQPQLRQWEAHQALMDVTLAGVDGGGEVLARMMGLPTILDRCDLVEAQRGLVATVVAKAAAVRPGARWVLEKTPSNSLCVDLIDELCPDVRYVHILRDPREVVASLRAAGQGWGPWAPTDAAGGADMWRRHVVGARRAREIAPDRYTEVRYEVLRQDPRAALAPVLDLLGLDDDPTGLADREESLHGEALTEVFAFKPDIAEYLAELPEVEPEGFRRGSVPRAELSAMDLRMIAAVAGSTARATGHDSGLPAASGPVRAAWVAAARTQRALGAARRRQARRGRDRELRRLLDGPG